MTKLNKQSTPLIVLVDDEQDILFGSSIMLRQAGLVNVRTIDDSRNLLPFLSVDKAGVIVLDLQMPFLSGKELLIEITANYPELPVIIVTAANEVETAIDCMKMGAFDFLVKPIEMSRFVASVSNALKVNAMHFEIDSLRESILSGSAETQEAFSTIKTRCAKMKAILSYLEAVAPTDQPVLITGETGVGKELIARAIHDLSGRSGNFVAINSAGFDDHMFADALFGHKKGAFTGADQVREGMIASAAGGTLFLDEVGEMTPASQIKLLRLLQEGEYFPLGADVPSHNLARLVVATNRDLEADTAAGCFRRDLYYRFSAHRVRIPPLRERAEDIPLLLETFLAEAAHLLHKKAPDYPPELIGYLGNYSFPGNIRELRAMIFDALTRHKSGLLSLTSFKSIIGSGLPLPQAAVAGKDDELLNLSGEFPTLKQHEQRLIDAALSRSGGNQRAAAALLGISRQALNQRLCRK